MSTVIRIEVEGKWKEFCYTSIQQLPNKRQGRPLNGDHLEEVCLQCGKDSSTLLGLH